MSLRISRDYRVGRIYESLYLCRRWEAITDAQLSNEQKIRYAEYKDNLRTQEIQERKYMNGYLRWIGSMTGLLRQEHEFWE